MSPADLIKLIIEASELEVLAEVRERLLGLLKFPNQLLRVHIETVTGPTLQCRLSLELSDAGRDLGLALGARDIDRLVVEKALGHSEFSLGLQLGDEADSRNGVIRSAMTSDGGAA